MRKSLIVGITREANEKEKRSPLTPADVRWLIDRGIGCEVESNPTRVFSDSEYRKVGAKVLKRVKDASLLVGVKAPAPANVISDKIYMIFSHTIKGQKDNIALLKEMLKRRDVLVDHEKVRDTRGKRLVYFGRHAGICGLVDSFHYYGKKMKGMGINTPFQLLKPSWKYRSLDSLKKDMVKVGEVIRKKGFSKKLTPFIVGIIGRGNVSSGVQEMLGFWDVEEVHPRDMKSFAESKSHDHKKIYSIVFYREEKLRAKNGKKFHFEEYLEHPANFESNMHKYLPQLNMLINAGYWDQYYPRMVTRKMIKKVFSGKNPRLGFIADISCDVEGSIEITNKTTDQRNPVYTYNPLDDTYTDGYKGRGLTILAIDNLPTELPRDSSESFSKLIREYVYQVAAHGVMNITEHIAIPRELRNAVVTQDGELSENFQYLRQYLE
jgi:alanine dehydrogenase